MRLLERLAILIEMEHSPEGREKLLSDITKYLERKRSPRSLHLEYDELEFLRHVRNSLAHRRGLPDEEVRAAIPIFWRALEDAAHEFTWEEISHLLAYTLGLRASLPMGSDAPLRTRVKRYEDRFNKLPPEEKMMLFRSLLLSIYDTPEFQNYIRKIRTPSRHKYE